MEYTTNVIINIANKTLGNIEKVKLKDWFDQDCVLTSQTKVVAYKNVTKQTFLKFFMKECLASERI